MEAISKDQFTGLNLNRLETLTDGIFAIAMTILVLAIDIPENTASMTGEALHKAILSQSNQLISYGTSFLLLALFWTINHKQSGSLNRTNGIHIWINIIMLIFICLVPYTTSLKSDFIFDWMANLYFNVNMLIIALLYYINWSYATKNGRLTIKNLPEINIRKGKIASFIFIIIGILASIASFVIPENSSFIYFLIPLLKFIEGKLLKRKKIQEYSK